MNTWIKNLGYGLLATGVLLISPYALAGGTAKSKVGHLPFPPAVQPTPQPTFTGIYIGPEGGGFFARDKVKGSVTGTFIAPPLSTNTKIHQNGGVIGGVVGIGKQFARRGYIGLAVHGLYALADKQSKSVGLIDVSGPGESNMLNKSFDLKYFVTAVVTPGIVLNHHLLAYLNIGGAWASMQFGTFSTPGSIPVILSRITRNRDRFGFVGGVGIKWQVLKYFSLFTEYNYYYFGKVSLPSVVLSPDVTLAGQSNRVQFSTVTGGAELDFNL